MAHMRLLPPVANTTSIAFPSCVTLATTPPPTTNLQRTQELTLEGCSLHDVALPAIWQLSQLRQLSLDNNPLLTLLSQPADEQHSSTETPQPRSGQPPDALQAMWDATEPTATELHHAGAAAATNCSTQGAVRPPSLTHLSCVRTSVSDAGLQQLHAQQLISLCLGSEQLTGMGLRSLGADSGNLRCVHLEVCQAGVGAGGGGVHFSGDALIHVDKDG
jgi:hypothetical protein